MATTSFKVFLESLEYGQTRDPISILELPDTQARCRMYS